MSNNNNNNADFINKSLVDILKKNRLAPTKQPHVFSYNLAIFIENNGSAMNTSNAILYALYFALIKTYKANVMIKTDIPGRMIDAAYYALGKDAKVDPLFPIFPYDDKVDPTKFPETFPDVAYVRFLGNLIDKADIWIADLVAAWQTGALNERNVESYFRMADTEAPVTKVMAFVHFASSLLPKFTSLTNFVQVIKSVKWLEYHTSAASSQTLVRRLIDDTEGFLEVDDKIKDIVRKACEQPWDISLINAIPVKIVAITYVYLEAAGVLPQKWYQGEKAVSNMATFVRVNYREAFKKYIALKSKTEKLGEMTSISELQAHLGEFIVVKL